MNYWDSSEASEDVLAREVDEAMKPCKFSHSLCMFAACAKDGEQSGETVTEGNETLEVESDEECLSEEKVIDLLQWEEIINEFLFGVRQQVEVVMEHKQNGNAEEIFQGGKQMYFFNEIADEILQCDGTETRTTQEVCQKKDEAGNEGCDEVLKRFHREIEFLERWLKEPDGEVKLVELDPEEITVTMHDRDEIFIELNEYYYVSVCTENNINRYDFEV